MNDAGRFSIAPDHPCLAGHFPGAPVVPGAVLLDHVLAALGHSGGAIDLPSVKFLRPVYPAQQVDIFTEPGQRAVRFECRVDGIPVLRGQLRHEAAGEC